MKIEADKIISASSVIELETYLLKEIKITAMPVINMYNVISSLFSNTFYTVMYKDDENIILKEYSDDNYHTDYYKLLKTNHFDMGDIILSYNDYFISIDKGLFDNSKLSFWSNIISELTTLKTFTYLGLNSFIMDNFDYSNDKIDEKFITDRIEKLRDEIKENKKSVEDDNEVKIITKNSVKMRYEEDSIGKEGVFGELYIEVTNNIIKAGGFTLELTDDVSKQIPFEAWDGFGGRNLEKVEKYLITNKLPYTKIIDEYSGKREYTVKYVGDMPTINGVTIPKSKRTYIFGKVDNSYSEEKLKQMKRLSQIKITVTKLDNIEVNRKKENIKIPMKIDLVDDSNFDVELFGKRLTLSWRYIKELFVYGRSTWSSLNSSKLLRLSKEFGLSKQETFDYLKKALMLQKLEGENESN